MKKLFVLSLVLLTIMSLAVSASETNGVLPYTTSNVGIDLTVDLLADTTFADMPDFNLNIDKFTPNVETDSDSFVIEANGEVNCTLTQNWSALANSLGISQSKLLWKTGGDNHWIISPNMQLKPTGSNTSEVLVDVDNGSGGRVIDGWYNSGTTSLKFSLLSGGVYNFKLKLDATINQDNPRWTELAANENYDNAGVMTLTIAAP